MAKQRLAFLGLCLAMAVAGCQSSSSSPAGKAQAKATPPPGPQGARLAGLDSSPSVEADDAPAEVAAATAPTTEPAAAVVEPRADPVGVGLIVAAFAGVVLTVTNIDYRDQRAHRSAATRGPNGAGTARV